MIGYVLTTRGALFVTAPADLVKAAELPAMQASVRLLGDRLRANLSGGVVHAGPGRYGHIADTVRGEVVTLDAAISGRVFLKGKAAFRAPMLELGTRAHALTPRRRKGERPTAMGWGRHPLALHVRGGIVFRQFAHHPGAAARHPVGVTAEEGRASVREIFAHSLLEVLGRE